MSDSENYQTSPDGGDGKNYDDFYRKLRRTAESYVSAHAGGELAEYLLYVPDFFYLLVKLSSDKRVPAGNKAQIAAALVYFLSPIDVIPDAIPGLGWLDDLYVALIVVDNLLNAVEPEVVEQYWPGNADIVRVTKNTMDRLNDKLGAGAIRRILAKFRHGGDGGNA